MKSKVIMLLRWKTRLIESHVPFSQYKMYSTHIEALEYEKCNKLMHVQGPRLKMTPLSYQ